MGQLHAFQLSGCRLWFHTGDHGPQHFHAGVVDAWEIRVFFLQEPPEYDVRFQLKRVPARTVRTILELAAVHRAKLFTEWKRSHGE
ncbi:MAG: DUF4160 domain-containing protein [Gemmatimonadota bacterium]|nr:DUF4160 domain-containing protein [Gemmatimonadota bacterium]